MTRRVVDIEEDISYLFDWVTIEEAVKNLKELQSAGYTTLDYKHAEDSEFAVFAQKWRDETEAEARVREELEMVQDRAEMGL